MSDAPGNVPSLSLAATLTAAAASISVSDDGKKRKQTEIDEHPEKKPRLTAPWRQVPRRSTGGTAPRMQLATSAARKFPPTSNAEENKERDETFFAGPLSGDDLTDLMEIEAETSPELQTKRDKEVSGWGHGIQTIGDFAMTCFPGNGHVNAQESAAIFQSAPPQVTHAVFLAMFKLAKAKGANRREVIDTVVKAVAKVV